MPDGHDAGLAQKLYTVAFVASLPFVVPGALFAAYELGYSRELAFIAAFSAPFAWLVVGGIGLTAATIWEFQQ